MNIINSHVFTRFRIIFIVLSFILSGCSREVPDEKYPIENRLSNKIVISTEMEDILKNNILNKWYPNCVDSVNGGYYSNFDKKWRLKKNQPKFIVTQARHVWTAAKASEFFNGDSFYLDISRHGFKFLADHMWDKDFGGFFEFVTREGKLPDNSYSTLKKAYGNAFGIYALAAYYSVSHDESALKLAVEAFQWLEKGCHDSINLGYYQFSDREGNPFKDGMHMTPPKDHNSSIHILEAFTELYKVWPDKLLAERLAEMLHVVRDIIVHDKGYLKLFFRKDWSHVSYNDKDFKNEAWEFLFDHISFGHDVETAYLMIEASEVLGLKEDSLTHTIAKKLVDHALNFGYNTESGAIYDAGYYFHDSMPEILNKGTQWWSACEAFNAFLLMSELYPDDILDYYDKFTRTWNYCKNYLIDEQNGGWYRVGTNLHPDAKAGDKGDVWKGAYHNSRALVNSICKLKLSD